MRWLLTAAAVVWSGAAVAQDAEVGATLFEEHCAVCHGLNADGRGPMAGALVIQPPDLTQLSARNGGTFPTQRTVFRIDGREAIVSHGSPMWIFGELFDGEDAIVKAETGQPILTSQPIVDLVAYLEGVQG